MAPDLIQRVQTTMRLTRPFIITLCLCRLGNDSFLERLFECDTLFPIKIPFPQTSHERGINIFSYPPTV